MSRSLLEKVSPFSGLISGLRHDQSEKLQEKKFNARAAKVEQGKRTTPVQIAAGRSARLKEYEN
jgi:hypothetical protein